MSVPAKRHSRSRGARRRAHDALKPRVLVPCSQCKKPTYPHRACAYCGYYRGRSVVKMKSKTTKTKKKASK